MNYDGKVVISTALDNKGLEKGLKNVSGSLGGLKSVLGRITGLIATAFSVRAIVQFGAEASKATMQLSDAMTGLQSIVQGQGRSFSDAQAFIEEYINDGLIPATNAVTAYKNLAMRGYDDSQIKQTMIALKDASAFGRQASMTMGEAVQSATEGLKNENSILVDNAGVTKNVAKMWDEYATSIGTTSAKLTQEQKIQAEVNGILEQSKYQSGDAAKVAGTLSGRLRQLSFNFNNLKIASGNAINPVVQSVLPVLNTAIQKMTEFANAIATVVGTIFGKVTVQTESIANAAGTAAEAENALASGIGAASKAAKKSLAGFDELNTLQDRNSGSAGSSGATAAGSFAVDSTISESGAGISGAMQKLSSKIKELLLPLKNIDLGPAKDAFDKLQKSLSKLGKTIETKLEDLWFDVLVPLGKWVIEKAAPKAIDVLSGAFEVLHAILEKVVPIIWDKFLEPIGEWTGDLIIGALGLLADALSSVAEWVSKNAEFVAGFVITLGTLYGAFTAIQGAISIFNGAMSLLSNPAAPLMLASVAVAGLVGAILSLSGALEPAPEDVNALTHAEQALIDNSITAAENLTKQKEATQAAMDGIVSEMGHVEKLATELGTLADASGKVQEKDQGRAQFILNELNVALGTEYEMVDGVIQQYDSLASSIKDTINAKLAESLLDTYHENYVAAKKEEANALSSFAIATENYNEHLKATEAAESEYFAAVEEFRKNSEAGLYDYDAARSYVDQQHIAALEVKMDAERDFCDEARKTYEEAATAYKTHYDTITTYENAYTAALEGNTDKAIDLLTDQSEAYGTYSENISKETQEAVDALFREAIDAGLAAEETKRNFENGVEGYTQEMVDESEQAYQDALDAYSNAYADAQSVGEDMGDGLSDGMENKRTGLVSKAKSIISGMISAMRTEADAHSPARKTIALGEDMGEGTGIGIKNETKNVVSIAKKQTKAVIDAMSSESRSSRLFPVSFPSLVTPKIPKLAQGAVLPPNQPFMAIVGDQRHGTNVEAPLTTIQEAVAIVMQDFIASNMAGHEATVAMLREILEAILGIQIGDDVIAAAYDRYRTKMAIVNGG